MNRHFRKCKDCGRLIGFGKHLCVAGSVAPSMEAIRANISKTESGCWKWLGHTSESGYGIVAFGGLKHRRRLRVHRLVWELVKGIVPSGLCVLHRCDIRNCCNPDHLFLGTRQQNTADMVSKKRQAWGVRNGTHVLLPDQVVRIRRSKKSGRELANEYKVNPQTIYDIKNGVTWSLLPKVNSTSRLSTYLAQTVNVESEEVKA